MTFVEWGIGILIMLGLVCLLSLFHISDRIDNL